MIVSCKLHTLYNAFVEWNQCWLTGILHTYGENLKNNYQRQSSSMFYADVLKSKYATELKHTTSTVLYLGQRFSHS